MSNIYNKVTKTLTKIKIKMQNIISDYNKSYNNISMKHDSRLPSCSRITPSELILVDFIYTSFAGFNKE